VEKHPYHFWRSASIPIFIFAAQSLANFLKLASIEMTVQSIKKWISATLLTGISLFTTQKLHAQDWGSGWGSADTASKDSSGNASSASETKVAYQRFVPPYDTMREIIFYEGIIEDENCENCQADSLYWRTKKYLSQRYGKEKFKDKSWVIEDQVAKKIVLRVTIPMVVQINQFNKAPTGSMEFKLAVRFQDGRYKYQCGNFVHLQSQPGTEVKQIRTSHEYYMRVKKGYQRTDLFLLAADREVKSLVEGLRKSLKAPYQPDEDDW
jgi:hypothetical protein